MGAAVCTARRSFESTARQSQQQDGSNLKPNNYAAAACTRRTTVSVLRESVTSPDATTFPVTLISSPSAFELHLPSTTFFCRIGSESLDFLSPQFEILMQFPFHLLVTWGACSSSAFQFGMVPMHSTSEEILYYTLATADPRTLERALFYFIGRFMRASESRAIGMSSMLRLKHALEAEERRQSRNYSAVLAKECTDGTVFTVKQGILSFF